MTITMRMALKDYYHQPKRVVAVVAVPLRSTISVYLCPSMLLFLVIINIYFESLSFGGIIAMSSWKSPPLLLNSTTKITSTTTTTTTTTGSSSAFISPPDPSMLLLLEMNPGTFWDCNLPETPCRYWNPNYFFHNGSGKEFLADYKRLGGTNNNLPAITALSWWWWRRRQPSAMASTTTPDISSLPFLPHNVSFIHVHKCGGTTVQKLLGRAKRDLQQTYNIGPSNRTNPLLSTDLRTFKYSVGGGSVSQKEQNRYQRQDHVNAMVQAQQQQLLLLDASNSTSSRPGQQAAVVIFTVVRDPIERFISAVQQVMHYNDDFRTTCLKRTARATLQCAIQYSKDTDYLRDVHLVPMATHFRLWTDHPTFDHLAVLHLNDIGLLADYFGRISDNTTTTSVSAVNNSTIPSSQYKTVPHSRDRSQVDYATSPILAHMSVQRDCTPSMIQELCQLYAVDVAMMQSLGFETPLCN